MTRTAEAIETTTANISIRIHFAAFDTIFTFLLRG